MKIVNIEDYYIPDAGYQINILPKYLASFGHEVYIITSTVEGIRKPAADFFGTNNIIERDQEYTLQTGVKIIRIPPLTTKMFSGRIIQSKSFFRTVEELHPDIVYVHGNDSLTGMRYLRKKQNDYALVTDSHMLNMATKNRMNKLFYWFYRKFVTPNIIRERIPVIRTQDDLFVEKCLGIPLAQAPWISYGTDTMLFHPDAKVKKSFRVEHGIAEDDFVVVYTGKLDEAKGGKLLAEAFVEKFDSDKNIVLIVVGNTDDNVYGKKVDYLFSKSKNRIIRFSTQKYADLPKFYQAADVSVFGKQCSLSFYDAQGCGLPVVSEDNNINVERNSHGNGLCFRSGDINDFRNKISLILSMSSEKFRTMSNNAYKFIIKNYNYELKAREYETILLTEYNRLLSHKINK